VETKAHLCFFKGRGGCGCVYGTKGGGGPKKFGNHWSILYLITAINKGGWSTPRPGRCTPAKDTPILQGAGWAPGPVWTGAKNLAPTGIRSPNRPIQANFFSVAQQPISGVDRLVMRIADYTHTHTRYDSPKQVISPSQRPPPT
jgi:hypothetical protein